MTHANTAKSFFTVQPGECDDFGFINYHHYLEWINGAKHDFFSRNGADISLFQSREINLVTVNFNLRCLATCRNGDRIAIEPSLERLMPNSIYCSYNGINTGTGEPIFKADTIMYAINPEGNPVTFPHELLDILQNITEK